MTFIVGSVPVIIEALENEKLLVPYTGLTVQFYSRQLLTIDYTRSFVLFS